MKTITFLVHGKSDASRSAGVPPRPSAAFPLGTVKQSVQIGVLRGTDSMVPVPAVPGEDVVVLHIENGPSLVLHPENARDLLLAQNGTLDPAPVKTRGNADPASGLPESERQLLQLPATLEWAHTTAPESQRGIADKVVLAGIEVLTGFSIDKAADAAAAAVVAAVDDQVDPGVYALNSGAMNKLKGGTPLSAVPDAPDGKPVLVLVHGTFSNTEGTFGKLWTKHPALVKTLFERYADRVYALDHQTLGESPIANALMLAEKLADGTRLHLLTHSRGGLVAEVLARAASLAVLSPADEGIFKGDEYAGQLGQLRKLVAVLREKAIRVERVVRVACPARGTLLASGRLDAYVSVLKWAFDRAQIPVLPAVLDFLGAVAKHKSDPATIPGLAAQMPESPLVQWLHAAAAPVQGQLRVVAGDVQGDSIMSWIKTLLADSFYWTDNDFVVQTSSMYGGAPRAAGATFLLSRGGAVSHFSYFSNEPTARAVVSALTKDLPDDFRVIGPLSAAGNDASGSRAPAGQPNPDRPALLLLPGILGSHLKAGDKRIWLDWGMVNGLLDLEYKADADNVTPDGPIGRVYDKLSGFLSNTHQVIEFDFDWRKPIEQEAERLAAQVELQLDAREATGQPVRLLAHSMGGLVARVMQLRRPKVWERLMSRPGARLLMLGTPNGGSWAPMQVLSGDDSFGNALVAFGAPFQDAKVRAMMASFPGFLQMQAGLLDLGHGLGRAECWAELAAKDLEIARSKSRWHNLAIQLRSFEWGVPTQQVLDQAVKLRIALDSQRDKLASGAALAMVLGRAKFTPAGFENGDKGLTYLDAPDQGDGRVTLDAALLPGVPSWQVDCEHGALPAREEAFPAYLDLLERGSTTRLGPQLDLAKLIAAPVNRSAWVPNRGARRAPEMPPDLIERLSSDAAAAHPAALQQPALAVTVCNGNLRFVGQPIMLGHYRSLQLSGAEKVMDKMIGGSMSESIRMGQYADALRTSQIFINLGENAQNPLQLPRPEAVIVVGLGHEGELKASHLSATVCLGVIAWAQRLAETRLAKLESFELAATLIGSGGSGMSAGMAARAIARGVSDANRSLLASKWPVARHLHLVEVFLDRATDAWRALGLLAASAPDAYTVTDRIVTGNGALRQALDTGYRGAAYDLLSAATRKDERGLTSMVYTLDTKRAREDVHAHPLQAHLVEMLVKTASNAAQNNPQLGFTLFKLLVPPEMEPFMGGTSDMQIQLDESTAGIPWELLNTSDGTRRDSQAMPWAIRVKLLRSLRTREFAATVQDAGIHDHILVIGEPDCDRKMYPALPGARREAMEVSATLKRAGLGEKLRTLVSDDPQCCGPNAFEVINTLFERDWRIIHISGHGIPPSPLSAGGVVLSDDTFFGPSEVSTMRVVPSLVFVNCCHLGAQDAANLLNPQAFQNRAKFAANVAQALIEKGVRCVIAAGWAVNDAAAVKFAGTFYAKLAANERFIDAVAAARHDAYDPNDNTWAAYQCYGDPDWRLRPVSDPNEPVPMSLAEEFASVCSAPSLILALESIITQTRFRDHAHADSGVKVLYLDRQFGQQWGAVGAVAEAFGIAWAEARDLDRAIAWHIRARGASDGSASIRSVEQLGHLLVRTAWERVRNMHDDMQRTPAADDKARLAIEIDEARSKLHEGLGMLVQLNAIQPSPERESLCASAFKRKVMLEQLAGRITELGLALESMEAHYRNAEKTARDNANPEWYYPALNRFAAQLLRQQAGEPGAVAAEAAAIRCCIEARIHADPDFYSVVAGIELDFYLALAGGSLATEETCLVAQFDDLYRQVQAPRWWNSVRDQIDFVGTQLQHFAGEADRDACQRIRDRLGKIAPRSRTPEPEHMPGKYPAFA